MRQETGSKPRGANKIVSVRITSDRDNFSNRLTHIPLSEDEQVSVVVESSKAMLLPTTLLSDCTLEEHLLSAGIDLRSDREEVIIVDGDKITTALIVIPKSLLSKIEESYGDKVRFTTPLLSTAIGRGHEVRLHLSSDKTLLCINLFNGGDRIFAELFEVKNSTDVLYWLSRIGEGYDFRDYTIYIDGGDRELTKLLKRYYKNIKSCE